MTTELQVLDNRSGTHTGAGFMQSGCNPEGRCGNGLEKIYPTCAVRYGYMRYLGEFRYAPGMKFNCGGKVVVQTNRGIELGEQVSLTCSGCDKSINRKQIMDYVKQSGPEFLALKAGRILRVATPADLDEQAHLNMAAAHKLLFARKVAQSLELPMKFVTCEHLLGGERILFHFMSEERIDFRELVRQLAQEYHTRIEMHQVGARDEARLVADYEICGRECCCKNFLKKLRQVNMKMAKLQKATLDPSKVSGRCGRLRCCLRYEHEGYEELNRKLPKVGSRIRTEKGTAVVEDRQILTQLLSIQYEGTNEWETITAEEVLEKGLPRLERQPDSGPPADARPGRGAPADRREPRGRDDRPRPDRAAPPAASNEGGTPRPGPARGASTADAGRRAMPPTGDRRETTPSEGGFAGGLLDGDDSGAAGGASAAPASGHAPGEGGPSAEGRGPRRRRNRRRKPRPDGAPRADHPPTEEPGGDPPTA